MAVRMVLVSLVASLGLSLPTSDDFHRWTSSTHEWLDTQLAAWDSRMPSGTQAFVYYAEGEFPEAAAVVEPQVKAESESVVAAPEAIAAPEIAEEEVFYDVEDPKTEPTLSPVVTETIETPKTEPTLSPVVTETIEAPKTEPTISPVASEKVETPKTEPTLSPVASDRDFELAMTDVLAVFATDRASVDVENEAVATATPAPTEPVAQEVISDRLAEEMVALFEMENRCLVNPAEPARGTENIAVSDEINRDATQELNGKADGGEAQQEAVAAEPAEGDNARARRIIQAVKLTREAALAWANLLHAPAVVTINHGSTVRE